LMLMLVLLCLGSFLRCCCIALCNLKFCCNHRLETNCSLPHATCG
jgi:hypothetical protein